MKKSLPNFSKGFTLIELIIVFSVIAILSTVSVASFVNFSRQQTRSQAIGDFINALNTAKVKAASQINQCPTGKVLNGYSVTLNTSPTPNTYSLNIVCIGISPTVISTTPLPPGISFNPTTDPQNPTTTTNIFFPILTGGVVGNGKVVFSSQYLTDKKTISVDSVGVIK